MNRNLVIALSLTITIGSTLWCAVVFQNNPGLGLFILVGGLISSALFAGTFLEETPPNPVLKSWDHMGRDIEELHRYPSTIGDKVRGLKELVSNLSQMRQYDGEWVSRLRVSLSRIETLRNAGNVREAAAIAVQEIDHAAEILVAPRVKAVNKRLAAEAAADAQAARVEFVTDD
ncbi:MAG: hypothetical protein K2W82_16270 [Candidatus Obscuribacterales bacterium]|nr:hypothetical protein [Candidatus Obscuribacterales bacterium]